jgi:A/G-specific adenine glycosylase
VKSVKFDLTNAANSLPSPAWRQTFRRKLLAWYRRSARDLPWRRTRDPYAIWVSEVMLQQTQVATVVGYFERFLAEFPTIAALGRAPEERVLRIWEGLGYYRRARQLRAAAGVIVAEHGGKFPRNPEAVRSLPGIGRYTAGAILSIAFDLRQPILEANTYRLLARLLAFRGEPTSTAGQQRLWAFAEALLPYRRAGLLNQALMELGSQICTPRAPACETCPVHDLCPTYAQGLQDVIPPPKKKPVLENVREVAVFVRRGDRALVVRQHGVGRWAGLWNFPRFESSDVSDAAIVDQIRKLAGIRIRAVRPLANYKHGVTRFRITLDCFAADYSSGELKHSEGVDLHWADADELAHLPLPVTGRKMAQLVIAELRETRLAATRSERSLRVAAKRASKRSNVEGSSTPVKRSRSSRSSARSRS